MAGGATGACRRVRQSRGSLPKGRATLAGVAEAGGSSDEVGRHLRVPRQWEVMPADAVEADEVGEGLQMYGMPGRIEEGLGETLG